jgi:glycosyltransferase involved in cell wall biosynthesis
MTLVMSNIQLGMDGTVENARTGRNRMCYIANTRYPTEKADGYQISKMCEAFSEEGWEVELWHPYRRQRNAETALASPREFYQLRREFVVRRLPNIDVMWPGIERWRSLTMAVVTVQYMGWAWFVAHRVAGARFDLHYTREPAVALFLTRSSLPTVLEIHRLYRRFQAGVLRRLAKAPALMGVVSMTTGLKDDLRALGFGDEKTIVEHDAVDWAHFCLQESAAECRRRLGLPADRWIVGYSGAMRAFGFDKGLRQLLTAACQVEAAGGRKILFLSVGGTSEDIAGLRRFAAKRGLADEMFRFQSRVPWKEIPLWLKACDVLCVPWPPNAFSARHTSPLKLFEYMAAGVPILATDLPALREVLAHGVNAVLVPSDHPDHLADGLRQLLGDKDLRERLANRARQDAVQRTWTMRARRIAAAFAGNPR